MMSEQEPRIRYKSLIRDNNTGHITSLHYPEVVWTIGEWKTETRPIRYGGYGYHCSVNPFDAWANGLTAYIREGEELLLSIVEVDGRCDTFIDDNDECRESLRLLHVYRWTRADEAAFTAWGVEEKGDAILWLLNRIPHLEEIVG